MILGCSNSIFLQTECQWPRFFFLFFFFHSLMTVLLIRCKFCLEMGKAVVLRNRLCEIHLLFMAFLCNVLTNVLCLRNGEFFFLYSLFLNVLTHLSSVGLKVFQSRNQFLTCKKVLYFYKRNQSSCAKILTCTGSLLIFLQLNNLTME